MLENSWDEGSSHASSSLYLPQAPLRPSALWAWWSGAAFCCHSAGFLHTVTSNTCTHTHTHTSADWLGKVSLICCCCTLHCLETLSNVKADVFLCRWHPLMLDYNRWLWTAGPSFHACVRTCVLCGQTALCLVDRPVHSRHPFLPKIAALWCLLLESTIASVDPVTFSGHMFTWKSICRINPHENNNMHDNMWARMISRVALFQKTRPQLFFSVV